MPTLMPSLLKYFVTVGAMLFIGLVGLNAVLEPGGPGLRIVHDTSKAKLVRHDPRASLVERLREEEAAQKASGRAEASPVQPAIPTVPTVPTAPAAVGSAQPIAVAKASVTQAAAVAQPQLAKPAAAEPPVAPTQVAAQPATASSHQSAAAALTGALTEDEARANRVAEEKAASEKSRKKRVARERARAKALEEASAARQQDRYFYGQRSAYAYSPPPPQQQQRPVFGPFSQNQGGFFGGGWGR